ncbi:hypothetical protein RJ639_040922 [Escallonia herrerae]|uniref:Chromo domain-containing protein n=1 Tax=Escallonia herrerae TaxID=1293975 RepID=A0AA89B470_9ASTE|nr:hypothetical protein RJ639_040922 [Escallonia herrerae]
MANTKERIDALEAQIHDMFKSDQDAPGILKQFSLRLDALEVNLEATDNTRYAESMEWEGKFQELQDRVEHHARHSGGIDWEFKFQELQDRVELLSRAVVNTPAGGAEHSSRPRVPEPKSYGGARDAKELENFLFDVEQYFRAIRVDSEATKVSMAAMYLVGDAKLWWRKKYAEIEDGSCVINTWEILKRELKSQFFPENTAFNARKALLECKHTGSVREYCQAFSALMLDISDMSAVDRLFFFMEGLKPWARTELNRRRVNNLNEAIIAAESLSDYNSEPQRPPQRGNPSRGIGGKKPGGPMPNQSWGSKSSWASNSSTQQKSGVGFKAKPDASTSGEVKKPPFRGCFLCQGPHVIANCPQRQMMNAFFDNIGQVQRGEQSGSRPRHPPTDEQTDTQDYEEEDAVGAFPQWCNAVTTQVGNPKKSSTGEEPKDMPPKKKGDVPGKGLMYVDIKVNGKAIRAMVDTGATHNYISSTEVERLGLTLEKGCGRVKAINSAAQPVAGIARSILIKIGPYEGRTNFSVVIMDDFKLILGLEFLCDTKTTVMPCTNSLVMLGNKPCVIPTISSRAGEHASDFALGGVLMQEGHPVAYESRKLNEAERRYTTHEKELLAVVHCLRIWRHYLLGSSFIVRTDNTAVSHFLSQSKLTSKQARWQELLAEFNFMLEYRTGSTNSVADALSRKAELDQVALMAMNAIVRADSRVAINIGKKIKKALTRDPVAQQLLKLIESGKTRQFWQEDGLLMTKGRRLCFNSRKSSSTGKSAFEIVNGQQPLLPHTVNVPNAGKSPRAISFSEEWRQNIDLAHSYLEKAARRMKKHADKNRRSQEFNVGDKVMDKLLQQDRKFLRGRDSRLLQKYEGPLTIVKKIGKMAYKVDPPQWWSRQLYPVFHVSMLKPFYEDTAEPSRGQIKRQGLKPKAAGKRVAEAILNDRVIIASRKRHQEYLVKWQGQMDEENTWERAADLSAYADKIEAYHMQKLTRASTALVGENVTGCPLHPPSTAPPRPSSSAPPRPSNRRPCALTSSSSLAPMRPSSTAPARPIAVPAHVKSQQHCKKMVGRRAAAGAAAYLLRRLKLQKERYEGTCLWRNLEKLKLVPQQAEDVQPGSVQIVLNPEDLKKLSELEKGTDYEAFLKKVSDIVVLSSVTEMGLYGAGLASQLYKDGIPKTAETVFRKVVGDFEVEKASLQKLIDEQINGINAVMERLDKLKEANQDGNGEENGGGGQSSKQNPWNPPTLRRMSWNPTWKALWIRGLPFLKAEQVPTLVSERRNSRRLTPTPTGTDSAGRTQDTEGFFTGSYLKESLMMRGVGGGFHLTLIKCPFHFDTLAIVDLENRP